MKRSAHIKRGGFAVGLGLALALGGAAAAFASEPVATADPTGAPPASTADQIEQFIKAKPIPDLPKDGAAGVTTSGPRDRSGLGAVHGFVEVGAGTGGYRSIHGLAQMPLGDNATLTVSGGETRDRAWRGYGAYGGDWSSRTLGASLALGPAARAAGDPGCARSMDVELEPHRAWPPNDAPLVCRVSP